MSDNTPGATTSVPPLLAAPFRPFFLLTGLYAAVLGVAWAGLLFGGWALPVAAPFIWHSHEMLFGVVSAAIAGFLLTAMSNWTATPLLRGPALLALVLLWLAGRVVMWCGAWLPAELVAVVSLAFLPVLAAHAGLVLWRTRNRRNYGMPLVLLALAGTQLMLHLQLLDQAPLAAQGASAALLLLAVLMIVIAGRITPAFSRNWLRLHGGDPARVRNIPGLDVLAISSAVLLVPVAALSPEPRMGAFLALLAAACNGARLMLWNGWQVRREPLLWILHLGYAWIVLALLLKGLSPFAGWPATLWLHALGTGAAGTLIIGVMTRVSLGHTGRPLQLPRAGSALYWSVTLAAMLRLLVALGVIDDRAGLLAASAAWSLAFLGFVLLYWRVLTQPRADGKQG